MRIEKPYHNYFFLWGVFFYWILPVIALNWNLFNGPGDYLVYEYYYKEYMTKYIIIILLFVISFYSGSFLILRCSFPKKTLNIFRSTSTYSKRTLYVVFLVIFVILLIIKYPAFKVDNYSPSIGTEYPIIGFTTTLVLLTSFIYLYDLSQDISFKKRLALLCLLLFILLFLLRSGTRMYFLIPCIMSLIYIKERKILSTKKLIIISLIVFTIILTIGISRIGGDFNLLSYILLGEPCFTWISAGSFLSYNKDLPLFAFPYNYFSSIITFIPKFIFPMKNSFIIDIPYNFDSPLGAINLFVVLIGNFGIIGSSLFLFLMGAFSSIIYKKTGNKFIYVYYIAYCSLIPFQFFRDGFSIVNKSIFVTFFILPAIILYMDRFKIVIRKTKDYF